MWTDGRKMRLDRGQIEVVDDFMADVLRAKTAAERIRIGFDLWTSTRHMLLAHLRKTHPDWNDERIKEEVARRLSHGDFFTKEEVNQSNAGKKEL